MTSGWLSFLVRKSVCSVITVRAKATLLRIMAGEDADFIGTARPASGIKIGYFPQEPRLDGSKAVEECIEEAVADSRAVLNLYNAFKHETWRGPLA